MMDARSRKIHKVTYWRPQGAGDVIDREEYYYLWHYAMAAKQKEPYFATIEEIEMADYDSL